VKIANQALTVPSGNDSIAPITSNLQPACINTLRVFCFQKEPSELPRPYQYLDFIAGAMAFASCLMNFMAYAHLVYHNMTLAQQAFA